MNEDDFVPIGWEYDEDGRSWPIYSPADQLQIDRLVAAEARERHIHRMRSLRTAIDGALEYHRQTIGAMERTVQEAYANEAWHYAQDTERVATDQAMIREVQLRAEKFGATHTTDEGTLLGLPPTQLEEFNDFTLRRLHHSLRCRVYGHDHGALTTHATELVELEVPANWWQAFRAEVLKRKNVKMKKLSRTVTLAVSAKRFTAFPQLPYQPPTEWGPGVNLRLPLPPKISMTDWAEDRP